MLIKKGRDIFWCDNSGDVIKEHINDWKSPFGVEEYNKKFILNLIIPDKNDGFNVRTIIENIKEELKDTFSGIPNIPIKKRREELLRVEIENYDLIDDSKPLIVSGDLIFKIYNYKGDIGIKVMIV